MFPSQLAGLLQPQPRRDDNFCSSRYLALVIVVVEDTKNVEYEGKGNFLELKIPGPEGRLLSYLDLFRICTTTRISLGLVGFSLWRTYLLVGRFVLQDPVASRYGSFSLSVGV